MIRLSRIYTRSGDKGRTALGDGTRVPKHALRVEAFGTVDEANAIIGIAGLHVDGEPAARLARIQNDLFDLGADLCTPLPADEPPSARLRVVASQVSRLEAEIDAMNEVLPPLDSFILPGGTPASAHLHHARTVVRRAERLVASLAETEAVNAEALAYLNRLSDHLFVLARWLNAKGGADVLWAPGGNR